MDARAYARHKPAMAGDWLRQADWLHGQRARGWGWLLAALNLATLAWLLLTARDGVDRNGFLIGSDFLSFWTTGQMLVQGGNVYDPAAHAAAQRGFFSHGDATTAFFYPPFFLPFCWPLGWLPYFPALALWLGVTGGLFVWAVRAWFRDLGLGAPPWMWIAAFPPVLVGITHGQTAFLVPALLGGGVVLAGRRPWLAGVLIGLAVIKPQAGLMVPLVLLLTGQWRTILAAAASTLALGLLATLAFGAESWLAWWRVLGPAQAARAQGAIGYAKMMSVFAGARLLGAPMGLAYGLQAASALLAAALLAREAWGRRCDTGLGAAMLLGGMLATPFLLDYDLVLLAFPLAWLLAQGFGPWGRITAAAGFGLAAFARPLALAAGIPLAPMVLWALFGVVIAAIRAQRLRARG